jgi:hypothetical protein
MGASIFGFGPNLSKMTLPLTPTFSAKGRAVLLRLSDLESAN